MGAGAPGAGGGQRRGASSGRRRPAGGGNRPGAGPEDDGRVAARPASGQTAPWSRSGRHRARRRAGPARHEGRLGRVPPQPPARACSSRRRPGSSLFVVVAVGCVAAGLDIVGVVAGVGVGLLAVVGTVWRGRHRFVRAGPWAPAPAATTSWRGPRTSSTGCAPPWASSHPTSSSSTSGRRQALALGRRSGAAVLVVTSGLLESLDPVSLEGVLGARARAREAGRHRAGHDGGRHLAPAWRRSSPCRGSSTPWPVGDASSAPTAWPWR